MEKIIAFLKYSPLYEVKNTWSWSLFALQITCIFVVSGCFPTSKDAEFVAIARPFLHFIVLGTSILTIILYINEKKLIKQGSKRARITWERDYFLITLCSVPFAVLFLIEGTEHFIKSTKVLILILLAIVLLSAISVAASIIATKILIEKDYYRSYHAKEVIKEHINNASSGASYVILVGLVALLFGIRGVLVLLVAGLTYKVTNYQMKLYYAKKYDLEEYLIDFGKYPDTELW